LNGCRKDKDRIKTLEQMMQAYEREFKVVQETRDAEARLGEGQKIRLRGTLPDYRDLKTAGHVTGQAGNISSRSVFSDSGGVAGGGLEPRLQLSARSGSGQRSARSRSVVTDGTEYDLLLSRASSSDARRGLELSARSGKSDGKENEEPWVV
jgi:hypothetical protein